MPDLEYPWLRMAYIVMAAIAGAVTALSFTKWRARGVVENLMTLFVGASFAIFATPWIAHTLFRASAADASTIAFLSYLSASGSNTLLPVLIRWMARIMGQEKRDA